MLFIERAGVALACWWTRAGCCADTASGDLVIHADLCSAPGSSSMSSPTL